MVIKNQQQTTSPDSALLNWVVQLCQPKILASVNQHSFWGICWLRLTIHRSLQFIANPLLSIFTFWCFDAAEAPPDCILSLDWWSMDKQQRCSTAVKLNLSEMFGSQNSLSLWWPCLRMITPSQTHTDTGGVTLSLSEPRPVSPATTQIIYHTATFTEGHEWTL